MPKVTYTKAKSTRAAIRLRALHELWSRGAQLDRIFDVTQQEIKKAYEEFDRKITPIFIVLCSRRLGKSVFCFGMADKYCRDNPNARVLYLSKTSDNLKEILDQASSVVLSSCPESISPIYKIKDQKYVYPNGSEIRFKGLDKTGPDVLRGIKSPLVVLDEFCFMEDLINLIGNVLMPMIVETGGRLLMASTPPKSPGHESIDYILKAEIQGSIIKKTVYDCPRWTEDQIEQFAKEAGGTDSDTFRREYMCEIITDRNRAILTACTADHMKEIMVAAEKPEDYIPDHYISIDPGGRDQTAILYSYYDYEEATLVIEDEDILDNPSTGEISDSITKKLEGDWKGIKPLKIVMDNNNLILVKDIRKLHNIHVTPTKKDKKEAQVNHTNLLIQNKQILINPRCKNLEKQCKFGIWNSTRTSYERSVALSHCDAVDALVYLVRNIDKSRNPVPDGSFFPSSQIFHGQNEVAESKLGALKKLFTRR